MQERGGALWCWPGWWVGFQGRENEIGLDWAGVFEDTKW
jgi:hypothetical protein